MATDARERAVGVAAEGDTVAVRWAEGHASRFPAIWLRDACACELCGDPRRGRRRFGIGALSADIVPATVALLPDGRVRATWPPDGHASTFEPAWLRARCPSEAERARRFHRPRLWDGTLDRAAVQLSYNEVMGGEAGLLALLERVRDYGLAFVRGVPPDPAEVERVAGLIGYIPETNFGRVFDYYADPNPSTPANASDFLPLHTDEAYRHRPPQIALFHAIRQSADGGGASLFADGFAAAERLRAEDADAFDLLTRVPAAYHRIQPGAPPGADAAPDGLQQPKHTGADLRSRSRAIAVDAEGRVIGFRFADINAGPPDLPEALIRPYYAAMGRLARIVHDPALRITVPLATGDMALFDNERVLHGRTAFDAAAGRRHIRSCYVDRESVHSQLRLLGRRLGRADAELHLAGGFGA